MIRAFPRIGGSFRSGRGCRPGLGLDGSMREKEGELQEEEEDRRCVQQPKPRFPGYWTQELKGREHRVAYSMIHSTTYDSMIHSTTYDSMIHSMVHSTTYDSMIHSMVHSTTFHSMIHSMVHSTTYHSSLPLSTIHSPLPPSIPSPPSPSSGAFHSRALQTPDSIGTTAPRASPILPSRSAPTPNRRSPRETSRPAPSIRPKLPFAPPCAGPELRRRDRTHDAKTAAARALAAYR